MLHAGCQAELVSTYFVSEVTSLDKALCAESSKTSAEDVQHAFVSPRSASGILVSLNLVGRALNHLGIPEVCD